MNKQNIEMGKKYRTRDGREVRIYATDHYRPLERGFSVCGAVCSANGWNTQSWTAKGHICEGMENPLDLIKASPYDDFKVDDKVYVWDTFPEDAKKRYFAGVDESGNPFTFGSGSTSWSRGEETFSWKNCLSEADYLKLMEGKK